MLLGAGLAGLGIARRMRANRLRKLLQPCGHTIKDREQFFAKRSETVGGRTQVAKAAVCKAVVQRFNSTRRLHLPQLLNTPRDRRGIRTQKFSGSSAPAIFSFSPRRI
jgi:hypothetical protein